MRTCIATVLAACMLSAAAVAAASEAEAPAKTGAAAALEQRVNVDFETVSLATALRYLDETVPPLKFAYDPALEKSRLDRWFLDLRLRQVRVRAVLDLILGISFAYVVRDDDVLIMTREQALRHIVRRTWAIGGLLEALRREAPWREREKAAADAGQTDEADPWAERLVLTIRTMTEYRLEAATWNASGGEGVIDVQDTLLVVRQTHQGNAFVGDFLQALEEALDIHRRDMAENVLAGRQPVLPVQMCGADPDTTATRQRLRRPISVDFYRTGFDEALRQIESHVPGITIITDPDLASAGIDFSTRIITLRANEVPAEEILSFVMGRDLGYVVRPGYVMVTTREKLFHCLPVRLYPVADLAGAIEQRQRARASAAEGASKTDSPPASAALDELTGLIAQAVNNEQDPDVAAWRDEGGPGALLSLGKVLVVMQTEGAHERIRDLLTQLRHTAAGPRRADAGERREEPDPYVARVRERLARPIDVAFQGTPVTDALARVATLADLNIVVDTDVRTAGYDLDAAKVSFQAEGLSTKGVVEALLPKGITSRVRRGFLLVLPIDKHTYICRPWVYPIADLVAPGPRRIGQERTGEGVGAHRPSAERMCQGLRLAADHEARPHIAPWHDGEGGATCRHLAGALIVVQNPHVHAIVARVLEALRAIVLEGDAEPQDVSPPPSAPEPAEEDACRRLLAKSITCDFENARLDDVLAYVREVGGVPIRIHQSIAEDRRPFGTQRVTMRAEGVTVAETLHRLLPGGFGWCVEGDRVAVMTRGALLRRTRVRLYPVGDLLAGRDAVPASSDGKTSAGAIEAAVRRAVAVCGPSDAARWAVNGGPAEVVLCGPALLVRQTEEGHRLVREALRRMREPEVGP